MLSLHGETLVSYPGTQSRQQRSTKFGAKEPDQTKKWIL